MLRPLTPHEEAVISFLVNETGSTALRAQLATARHAGLWSISGLSFDVDVDDSTPRAADLTVSECVIVSHGGVALGELFLHVRDGHLAALECSIFDDATVLPPVTALLTHADFEARGCTPF